MNYDRAIKTIRAIRGWSQQELAKRMKVDEAFVSRLCKPGSSPSTRTLKKVASALQVPMYLLVLLASDEEELQMMSKEQAEALSYELINLLLATEEKTSKERKKQK